MFLSYSSGKDYQRDYRKFFASRFIKIILPYVVFNIIYYFYFLFMGYLPTSTFSLTELLKYIFNGTLSGQFYFIVVIVQFYALAPLWDKVVKAIDPALVLLFSLLVMITLGQYLPDIIGMLRPGSTFIYNDRVFTTYLFYWIAGCYAGRYYKEFKTIVLSNALFISICYMSVAVVNLTLSYLLFTGNIRINWLENIHYLYCVSAILFFYAVSLRKYESKPIGSRLIKVIDNTSYYIYLLHCLIIFMTNDLMARAGIYKISTAYALRIVAVYTVTIGLCALYAKISATKTRTR